MRPRIGLATGSLSLLQDLTDDGDWRTTYTVENGTYEGMLLGLKRLDIESERFPMYDLIGSALGLVDENGSVTDSYELDTFGTPSGPAEGSTPNPYRFGAAWGYITDPSGLLQLGARYYWPEVGRFVSQDPIRDGANWYTYVSANPDSVDPQGLKKCDLNDAVALWETLKTEAKRCEEDRNEAYSRSVRDTLVPIAVGAFFGGGGGAAAGAVAGYICRDRDIEADFHKCLARSWHDYRVAMNRAGCAEFKPLHPPWYYWRAALAKYDRGIRACHSVGR